MLCLIKSQFPSGFTYLFLIIDEYTSEKGADWNVIAGDQLLSQNEDSEQTIEVKKLIRHPGRHFHIEDTSGKKFAIIGNDIGKRYHVRLESLYRGVVTILFSAALI